MTKSSKIEISELFWILCQQQNEEKIASRKSGFFLNAPLRGALRGGSSKELIRASKRAQSGFGVRVPQIFRSAEEAAVGKGPWAFPARAWEEV